MTDLAFEREVLERSREQTVVVDFWAPWCGPCRALGPVLEREIAARGGRVLLAKLNTDENPQTAAAYGISSIPAVKAFRDGQVVAEFLGARDARFVSAWLDDLSPSPARLALESALSSNDETALRSLVLSPEVGSEATLALARLLVLRGAAAEAEPLLAKLPDEAAEPLRRRLAFHLDAAAYGGEKKARAALSQNPADLDARWALASALAARGATEEALEELLELVARSRRYRDDGARRAMLALFGELGPDSDVARAFRRRLMILT